VLISYCGDNLRFCSTKTLLSQHQYWLNKL
jgi:hypothetical protein